MRPAPMILLLLGLLCLQACASSSIGQAPPTPEQTSFDFPRERYEDVFTAAVETLRARGFRVARKDYRFGTISTYPKEAATAFEFWIDDATTQTQKRADTLNAQQRTATIKIEPDTDAPETYRLTAEVVVERLQRPDRYLTHSATGRLSARYTAVPEHLGQRGIEPAYALTLTRDPWLEKRLVDAVRAEINP